METQRLGVEGACIGLETPDGRVFPVKDHTAEVPAAEARRFLDSGAPNVSKATRVRAGWSRRGEVVWERIFGARAREEDGNAASAVA